MKSMILLQNVCLFQLCHRGADQWAESNLIAGLSPLLKSAY